MDDFVVVCGFLGAWLLVAGPIYQAALELQEEQLDRTLIHAAAASVPPPERPSPWWWLVPPVAYIRQRRSATRHRNAVIGALDREELAHMVGFLNKANGWLLVASGAFLIAIKETWELYELFEDDLPVAAFWIALLVMGGAALLYTVLRMQRTAQLLGRD